MNKKLLLLSGGLSIVAISTSLLSFLHKKKQIEKKNINNNITNNEVTSSEKIEIPFNKSNTYGYFNTIPLPYPAMFNKPVSLDDIENFENSSVFKLLSSIPYSDNYINSKIMNERQKWFDSLTKSEKESIINIQNFNDFVFYDIVGINVYNNNDIKEKIIKYNTYNETNNNIEDKETLSNAINNKDIIINKDIITVDNYLFNEKTEKDENNICIE